MKQEADLIRARLKTPRAAAIAGILFSVLLIAVLLLFRLSVRADPLEAGAWLKTSSNTIALALNLVPFAGIAFLWFIGVLRDRLGELEDRFLCHRLSRQRTFVPRDVIRLGRGGGWNHHSLRCEARRVARFADVYLRPGHHLRDHEPLCGQDGGSVHDLYFHTRDPYRHHRTLDSVPWLCVRTVSPAERALY